MKAELRIFDHWAENPKLLAPLSTLLRVLQALHVPGLTGRWEIFRGASGYGEMVCRLESLLEGQASLVIDASEVLQVLLNGNEYFDHAQIRLLDGDVEFGIHDSTFLFVRGQSNLLNQVKPMFKDVEIVDATTASPGSQERLGEIA